MDGLYAGQDDGSQFHRRPATGDVDRAFGNDEVRLQSEKGAEGDPVLRVEKSEVASLELLDGLYVEQSLDVRHVPDSHGYRIGPSAHRREHFIE